MESLIPDAIWTFDTPYTDPDPLADGEIWEDEHGNEICRIEYPEILEKHCEDCGRLIAVRSKYDTQRGGRFNAVRYCPECARRRTERNKARWQKENRRDCRLANKELKREIAIERQYRAALEERLTQLKAEIDDFRLREAQDRNAGTPKKKQRKNEQGGGFLSSLLGGV